MTFPMYRYPEHLRAAAAELPDSPGVYLFLGEDPKLPLYIGKSVTLRTRVLSHLRNPREARLLHRTRQISHLPTAGDIGAQLLEAQLIKERYPLLNRRLRRKSRLCSVRLKGPKPDIVYAQDVDFAREPRLYGLYTSRTAALRALLALADLARLCHGALGLERLPPGRACLRALLGRCAGVCRGDETPQVHTQRLTAALEHLALRCWPYPGAIGVVERAGSWMQVHAVRN